MQFQNHGDQLFWMIKEIAKILYLNHHLIKNNQILATEKLIPKELYSLSIVLKNELPTSQKYFCNIFSNLQVEWKKIYLLPSKVSNDTNLRMFQHKILNNIYIWINSFLFLTKKIRNCVLTVNYKMKQLTQFLLNINLLWSYGVIWDTIVKGLCYSNFKSAECHLWILWNWSWFNNTFKPHTTIIQILYLFVKRLFKAFI